MQDDGVLCELVKVRDGANQDRRRGGHGDELARAKRLEGREQGVCIVLDRDNLRWNWSVVNQMYVRRQKHTSGDVEIRPEALFC